MTIQSTENLFYKNKMFDMVDYPLSESSNFIEVKEKLMVVASFCWRSYVGTWEIVDNRLYLTQIDAIFNDYSKVKIADLYPDSPDKVFAEWFSGPIVCNVGDIINFDEQIYEKELILTFKNGVLMKEKKIKNTKKSRIYDDIIF